jgi:hypothetical protein
MNAMKSAAWMSVAVLVAAAGLGGCMSYASYPAVPKNTAINNPNTPAMEEVMMAGLRWVASKYPPRASSPTGEPAGPAADVAVNLPKGVTPVVYRRVAAAVPGGQPLIPENQNLPTYHVTEVRVRGDEANIWILRPTFDVGASPAGGPVYQEVKLWLRGGLQPWHVVSSLDRTPGAEQPELTFYQAESNATVRVSAAESGTYKPRPKEAPVVTGQEQTPPAGEQPKP